MYRKQNLSVGNFINSKKFFDGRQTIREKEEIKSKRKEYSDGNSSIIDIELTFEHESMIRKILFSKNLLSIDTPEETM